MGASGSSARKSEAIVLFQPAGALPPDPCTVTETDAASSTFTLRVPDLFVSTANWSTSPHTVATAFAGTAPPAETRTVRTPFSFNTAAMRSGIAFPGSPFHRILRARSKSRPISCGGAPGKVKSSTATSGASKAPCTAAVFPGRPSSPGMVSTFPGAQPESPAIATRTRTPRTTRNDFFMLPPFPVSSGTASSHLMYYANASPGSNVHSPLSLEKIFLHAVS